ncbi:MAG: hypothetical protein JXQ93_12960 [Flavobacteriaceae bacterium]
MNTSKQDFTEWKKKHQLKRKEDWKNLITRGILVFGGIICISVFVYFWAIGSFQFLGKETIEVEASSVIVNDYHIGRGNYIPRLTVEYIYNSKIYTTYKNITDASKHQPTDGGDTIYVSAFVTFDVDNPNNCRVRLIYN